MAFGTIYVGPLLFAFISRHPQSRLALDLDDQIADLSGEGYDLGIRIRQLRDYHLSRLAN